MFKEDVVEKEENRALAVPKEFVKSALYAGIINFLNYSLKLPAIFSVIPLMVLILAIMLFTREWNHKQRQYAFLIPYVAEYFVFCLCLYNRGRFMTLTAVCMTAILAVWGVICIECFHKNRKKNLIGFSVLAIVACIAYLTIWFNYSAKAEQMVKRINETSSVSESLGREADALCTELNAVFFSRKYITFQLEKIAKGEITSESTLRDYREFKGNLTKINGKWISSFFKEAETIAGPLEISLVKDK